MSSMIDVLTNWVKVNYGIESLIDNLGKPKGTTPGKLQPTKNPNVYLQEVSTTATPSWEIKMGDIN